MKFKKALLINISEGALEGHWDQLDELVEKRTTLPKDSPDIMRELVDTECLLVAFGIPVTKEMIDTATGLKYIAIQATAFGKVDVDYAKSKNIPVSNLAGYSTEAVAEFSIASVLESIRQLEEGKQRGRAGNYSEEGLRAREIRNAIFGVIGLGSIGERVAEIASGFGADVRYWSRAKKNVPFTYQDADTLIAEADFLSLNLAQTPETDNFLNKKRIQSLKSGVVVINTVPMELVDADALAERLAVGDITFILDHSDETSKGVMAKLSQFKNCIIYPPMAYITEEAKLARKTLFLSNIKSFLDGSPTNVIN
ncbi:hypothetical protein A3A38_04855 [Candidatus Kaiserbacteria bacterium RIFCSPLOWO2_01_FULL_53_17]|uniref:Hydroxyacid dehydrogenase n=1 Tax=Candidatus Kaiserbacteria bacterium RIFCSPLOWO2_01_FULL_53_17 TaxID=1798511 RepID=A0A1F6EHH9_9BACT|nr:MAG: hypothetical protein A3A38_04855 [Candidatus Kaiserbacteria bacterium RIFCSPLOWO2_01_FULL_53_17]